jgi:hypothetical protein
VTLLLADSLLPTDPTLSAQDGGSLNVSNNSSVVELTAGQFGTLSNAGAGTTALDTGVSTGNIWSVGPVTLQNGDFIHGNVNSGSTVTIPQGATVTITGSNNQNQPIQIRAITISVVFPASTNDQTLNGPGDVQLTPGGFRDLTVNSGGGVILTAGSYFFRNLTVNSSGRFRIDSTGGAVRVNVSGSFSNFGGIESAINNSALNLLRIVYFGTTDVILQGAFTGTVVAPAATIRLQTNVGYRGAFLAKSIVGTAGITYTHDPFPASQWEPEGPPFTPSGLVSPLVARVTGPGTTTAPRVAAPQATTPPAPAPHTRAPHAAAPRASNPKPPTAARPVKAAKAAKPKTTRKKR